MSAQQWYVKVGDRAVGPLSSSQLKKLAGAGRLAPTTRVRLGDSGPWRPAARVRGLFPEIPPTPEPGESAVPPENTAEEAEEVSPGGRSPLRRSLGRAGALLAYGFLGFVGIVVVSLWLARNGRQEPVPQGPAADPVLAVASPPSAPPADTEPAAEAEASDALQLPDPNNTEELSGFLDDFNQKLAAKQEAEREAEQAALEEETAAQQVNTAINIIGTLLGAGSGEESYDSDDAARQRENDELEAQMRQERFDRDMERQRENPFGEHR